MEKVLNTDILVFTFLRPTGKQHFRQVVKDGCKLLTYKADPEAGYFL